VEAPVTKKPSVPAKKKSALKKKLELLKVKEEEKVAQKQVYMVSYNYRLRKNLHMTER
jgi:hypothetical protein